MKAALSVWDGRISPVFDVSREAMLVTIERGGVAERRLENIETRVPELKADRLQELGIDTLICGAISSPLRRELTARGMRVIGFVAGGVDDVLAGFVSGALPSPAFAMPGCGRQLRCRRGRGDPGPGRGHGGGNGGRLGRAGHR